MDVRGVGGKTDVPRVVVDGPSRGAGLYLYPKPALELGGPRGTEL